MFVKFANTEIPVLGGVVAGKTLTVKSVVPPCETVFGFAEPLAEIVVPPLPQTFCGLLELRGAGAVIVKSALLLSVSVQPPPLRNPAVVTLKSGVLALSKQLAVLP